MTRRSERKERVKRRLLIRKLCRWVPVAMRLDLAMDGGALMPADASDAVQEAKEQP
jgi:hypothetical protein